MGRERGRSKEQNLIHFDLLSTPFHCNSPIFAAGGSFIATEGYSLIGIVIDHIMCVVMSYRSIHSVHDNSIMAKRGLRGWWVNVCVVVVVEACP